jgi:flagellar protein FlaG
MRGVSASTLVIFIASILVAASVAGTLVTTVGDISSSAETQGDAVSNSIDTKIEILNDGRGSEFYKENGSGGSNVTMYVRNAGSTTLNQSADRINVLVDGQLIPSSQLTIESMESGDPERWAEDEVIKIKIKLDKTLDGNESRITVSVEGAEKFIEFKPEA